MKCLVDSWYQPHPLRWLLWPLSVFYKLIISVRRQLYVRGVFKQHQISVPVIVVGNITVGGTGKTPFVIWLTTQLKNTGYRPGIISRGYGGHAQHYPQLVDKNSVARLVGDEPVLIYRHTLCPMAVAPDRVAAARLLVEQHNCNIIISDDGLQHYALKRDIEIVIVDGQRQFGNQLCLPAGPLREPLNRIKQSDFIVVNSSLTSTDFSMQLEQGAALNLSDSALIKSLDQFSAKTIHAVAAIGNPQRFFEQLRQHNISVIEHSFTDHHCFRESDLQFGDDLPILMTEKDAVKCQSFAKPNMWFVPIEATIQGKLLDQLIIKLAGTDYYG
ncbi:MAG: tetraacyldisaccharide 4'-kinase [Gammaproteobacteria bacterium]|nr:tetraacyldisaccharide 4'-kinase [Gammaproteobacteria bacterium]